MPRTEPFDEYANFYEAWFEKHPAVYLSELAAIRHFLPKYGRGVEIGIGSGRFALPLGIKEGVEPSTAMQESAVRRGLSVIDGVAENLPFGDRSFDYALVVTTVCFVDDIHKSFHEINRILIPRGRVVVGMVDAESPLGRAYQQLKAKSKFYSAATFYSTDQVVEYLKETGFGDIEIVQTVFGDPESISEVQSFKPGRGDGGFVAIRAVKTVL